MFTVKYKASVDLCVEKEFLFQISEQHVWDAYYHPLLRISRSSDDKKHKEEGDVDVEVETDEVDEVDEKR